MISFRSNLPPSDYHRVSLDRRSRKRLAVPADVTDPFALDVFDVIRFSGQSATALEAAAKLGQGTICSWFRNFNPTVRALQSMLRHLGYELAVVPIEDDLQPGE